MSKQHQFKQFTLVHSLVRFDPKIGSYQELPFRARVTKGTMSVKGYSTFPKAPALQESHNLIRILVAGGWLLASAEMQFVYSSALVDSANDL